MTQQMAAYRAIIADMNEAGHWFPSMENEGGSAHPWAQGLRGAKIKAFPSGEGVSR